MAETGLCADGEQEKLLADGATEIHGTMPVNTDGGLIANGEPIGASGLRQVHELVRQLRGEAGERQVPGRAEGRSGAGLRRAGHRVGDDPVGLSKIARFGTRVRKHGSKISEMMFPAATRVSGPERCCGLLSATVLAAAGRRRSRPRPRPRDDPPPPPLHKVKYTVFAEQPFTRGDLLPRRRPAELGRVQPQPVRVQPERRGRRRPESAVESRRQLANPDEWAMVVASTGGESTQTPEHPLRPRGGRRRRRRPIKDRRARSARFATGDRIRPRRRREAARPPVGEAIARSTRTSRRARWTCRARVPSPCPATRSSRTPSTPPAAHRGASMP